MSSNAIEQFFQNQYGVSGVTFSDETYLLPAKAWVSSTFSSTWSAVKTALGIGEYIVDARDCDDFALICAAYARILHGRTVREQGLSESGFAFGEFWFVSLQGPHALNVFLSYVDDKLGAYFFEPQTGEIKQLTFDEIKSAILVRF